MAGNLQVCDLGNLTSSSGTWSGPFGYAGAFGYQEDATGLRLLGHRYYDPTTGRFLTRDPIKDGRNWYVYCYSDPLAQADPQGTSFIRVGAAVRRVVGMWVDNVRRDGLGRDTTDPEGYPVTIGGPVNWFNPPNNAITPNGVTYINPEDEESYWENKHWRDHEHRHVAQRREIAEALVDEDVFPHATMTEGKMTFFFLVAIILDYIESGGHDGALLERDAESWADNLQLWRER